MVLESVFISHILWLTVRKKEVSIDSAFSHHMLSLRRIVSWKTPDLVSSLEVHIKNNSAMMLNGLRHSLIVSIPDVQHPMVTLMTMQRSHNLQFDLNINYTKNSILCKWPAPNIFTHLNVISYASERRRPTLLKLMTAHRCNIVPTIFFLHYRRWTLRFYGTSGFPELTVRDGR